MCSSDTAAVSPCRRQWLCLLFLLAALVQDTHAASEVASLDAVPNKCISLRQGQACYQRVQLTWQTGISQAVCLWREGDSVALRCWTDQSSAKLRHDFRATQTTAFLLVAGQQADNPSAANTLARAEVKVAWIYNSRKSKRTRWRLF